MHASVEGWDYCRANISLFVRAARLTSHCCQSIRLYTEQASRLASSVHRVASQHPFIREFSPHSSFTSPILHYLRGTLNTHADSILTLVHCTLHCTFWCYRQRQSVECIVLYCTLHAQYCTMCMSSQCSHEHEVYCTNTSAKCTSIYTHGFFVKT